MGHMDPDNTKTCACDEGSNWNFDFSISDFSLLSPFLTFLGIRNCYGIVGKTCGTHVAHLPHDGLLLLAEIVFIVLQSLLVQVLMDLQHLQKEMYVFLKA